MDKSKPKLKSFNVRLPKEMWILIKKIAMIDEVSMNDVVINCVNKCKKSYEKKLTESDTIV